LAKAVNAPIFHVNGDSLDDVTKVFEIAAEYRQKFHTDIVIDLIGYRRFGHNELD
jgi:2-oxoglutarate dehydrogenase E1 component